MVVRTRSIVISDDRVRGRDDREREREGEETIELGREVEREEGE